VPDPYEIADPTTWHHPRVPADAPEQSTPARLSSWGRIWLLGRVWWSAAVVLMTIHRHRLPEAVATLGQSSGSRVLPPTLLSRAVSRGLRVGRWQPRCLIRSLVLYRLLRAQGDPADLVIGLAEQPHSHDAHAWVELGGRDFGPLPGRGRHVELARYPRH
jgi:hypothetical protein